MSVFSVRNALPVVTSIAAALFLATATPHELVPEPADAVGVSALLASADVQRCMGGGRDVDACVDEADGKQLVERADAVSRGAGR